MAPPPNKRNAAAKGAKIIREDQVAAKSTPGRIGSIDFSQFDSPTAQAAINEVAPPPARPIVPPGPDEALAAGALAANAALRDKVALAEGRPIDTGDNPYWGEFPAINTPAQIPIVERAIDAGKQTQSRLNPMQQSIANQLSQTEIGRGIAEQIQQGTPVREVVSPPSNPLHDLEDRFNRLSAENGGTFRPTPEMIEIGRSIEQMRLQQREARKRKSSPVDPVAPEANRPSDQRPQTSTLPVSRYVTPGTPEADRAAAVAAASGGMGSAGGGMGSGGGRTPPPRKPNEFDPDRPNRPDPPVAPVARLAGGVQLAPGLWNHLKAGWRAQAGDLNYSDSVVGDTFRNRKFPEQENSSILDKASYLGGRIGADVVGYGTRKGFWNLNPEDALGGVAREGANWAGLNGREAQLARYVTASTVGLVGANYNPFNLAEGGRTSGFSAINPTDEDARKTNNPIGELLFERAMLGRTGRLLPWQEFNQERPDVPYEKYSRYQDYIRGPSFLGLTKGTMDGIDGPEARIVGYRVQPEAVLAAAAAGAATIAAFKYGGKRL
jgi:hypothetical protein